MSHVLKHLKQPIRLLKFQRFIGHVPVATILSLEKILFNFCSWWPVSISFWKLPIVSFWFVLGVNLLNGEPSPLGGRTGPGWKVDLFCFLMRNFFPKTKRGISHLGPALPPSGWWLPIGSASIELRSLMRAIPSLCKAFGVLDQRQQRPLVVRTSSKKSTLQKWYDMIVGHKEKRIERKMEKILMRMNSWSETSNHPKRPNLWMQLIKKVWAGNELDR